jgi:hypothetical protein
MIFNLMPQVIFALSDVELLFLLRLGVYRLIRASERLRVSA